MPVGGSFTLGDLPPRHLIRLACDKCGRAGQYRRETLIERFGPEFQLPSLLTEIPADCPKVLAGAWGDRCGARFADRLPFYD